MSVSLEDMEIPQLVQYARQLQSQAGFVSLLSSNPETREELQRLIKKVDPKVVIPEIDAADKLRKEQKPLLEKLEGLEKQLMIRDAKDQLAERRSAIRAKYKLSDEDVSEVEKLMTTEVDPIPTHDAAARVYLASRRSAVPTSSSYSPPTYSMPETDIWAKGIGNPVALNRIVLEEAGKVWSELKEGKVPGLGAARGAAM